MLDYKNIFSISPFSLNEKEKENWYFDNQKKLTNYHYKNCKEYKRLQNKFTGVLINQKISPNYLLFQPIFLKILI